MASMQWSGGKLKSVAEVKAYLRHDDKTIRENTNHTNPHIQTDLTHFNQVIVGGTYEERCKHFDDRLNELSYRNSSGKNTPVICQALVAYAPHQLMDDFYASATTEFKIKNEDVDAANAAYRNLISWSQDVAQILLERFGEKNIISIDMHADELHEYAYQNDDGNIEMRNSSFHLHIKVIPENPDAPGKLSSKAFNARKNMKIVNKAIEDMTQDKYACEWNTGEQTKSTLTTPELKNRSEILEAKLELDKAKEKWEAEIAQRESEIEKRESDIAQLDNETQQIKAEAETLKKEAQEIKAEAERLKKDAEKEKAEAERLKKEVEKMKAEAAEKGYDDAYRDYMQEAYEHHGDVIRATREAEEIMKRIRKMNNSNDVSLASPEAQAER